MSKIEILTCPYCGFTDDICSFPDLFYTDLNNTAAQNEQYKLLLELNEIGYNIVSCGKCEGIFIHKTEE